MDNEPMNTGIKHIDIRMFKLKEFVMEGIMTLVKVEPEKQVADNLTKPPPRVVGVRLARGIMSGEASSTITIYFRLCIHVVHMCTLRNCANIYIYIYVYICM